VAKCGETLFSSVPVVNRDWIAAAATTSDDGGRRSKVYSTCLLAVAAGSAETDGAGSISNFVWAAGRQAGRQQFLAAMSAAAERIAGIRFPADRLRLLPRPSRRPAAESLHSLISDLIPI